MSDLFLIIEEAKNSKDEIIGYRLTVKKAVFLLFRDQDLIKK